MNVVLRENVTGVRVIRAFNKEGYEEKRMRKSFEDYAMSSIQANRLFVNLESIALFVINLSIVAILWMGGNRIGAGFMEIGDITALTQYAVMILFYIIMAQMVFIMLPRAFICVRRMNDVLSRKPRLPKQYVTLTFAYFSRFAFCSRSLLFSCKVTSGWAAAAYNFHTRASPWERPESRLWMKIFS